MMGIKREGERDRGRASTPRERESEKATEREKGIKREQWNNEEENLELSQFGTYNFDFSFSASHSIFRRNFKLFPFSDLPR